MWMEEWKLVAYLILTNSELRNIMLYDKVEADLQKRSESYGYITQLFNFLLHLLLFDESQLQITVSELDEVYAGDLDGNLFLILTQFISLLKCRLRVSFLTVRKESI